MDLKDLFARAAQEEQVTVQPLARIERRARQLRRRSALAATTSVIGILVIGVFVFPRIPGFGSDPVNSEDDGLTPITSEDTTTPSPCQVEEDVCEALQRKHEQDQNDDVGSADDQWLASVLDRAGLSYTTDEGSGYSVGKGLYSITASRPTDEDPGVEAAERGIDTPLFSYDNVTVYHFYPKNTPEVSKVASFYFRAGGMDIGVQANRPGRAVEARADLERIIAAAQEAPFH